jgi:hypothetical protein
MPNQRDPNKVAITVYVLRDIKAATETRAKERGETVTDVVTRALRRYVR